MDGEERHIFEVLKLVRVAFGRYTTWHAIGVAVWGGVSAGLRGRGGGDDNNRHQAQ